MFKKRVLIAVAVALSGCGSNPGTYAVKNSGTYARPYDLVWEDVVEWFAKNNVQIKTIDKSSGVIYAERIWMNQFDDTVSDCGKPAFPFVAVSRRASFNVFVNHANATSPTVTVTAQFEETRAYGANRIVAACVSKGVLENLVLRSISASSLPPSETTPTPAAAPTSTQAPPPTPAPVSATSALTVGTKLFSSDGAPFGTVVLISDTAVAVSLVGGGTVTMAIEQAIGMQAKKNPATPSAGAPALAPVAVVTPAAAAAPRPTARPAPPPLAVGTKLFNPDGSLFGTVSILGKDAVAVMQANGYSTVTISREQAISMQK